VDSANFENEYIYHTFKTPNASYSSRYSFSKATSLCKTTSPYHPFSDDKSQVGAYYLFVITMQKAPYRKPKNASCDQCKVDLLKDNSEEG
jgi:hypothetical protein